MVVRSSCMDGGDGGLRVLREGGERNVPNGRGCHLDCLIATSYLSRMGVGINDWKITNLVGWLVPEWRTEHQALFHVCFFILPSSDLEEIREHVRSSSIQLRF